MTTLLLYLDPLQSGSDLTYEWVLRAPGNPAPNRGSSALEELPQAEECVLVLPHHRLALHAVKLPAVRRDRMQGALRYAIEDALLGDAASTYAAIAGQYSGGPATVVTTDLRALERVLGGLRARGREPFKLIAETLSVPLPAQGWTAVLNRDGGFVRTGPHSGFSLDLTAIDVPPVQLRLALAQARAAQQAPARLRVHCSEHGPMLDRWRSALQVEIEQAAAWGWENVEFGSSPDLLQGELRRTQSRFESLRQWMPAAALAAAVVAIHVGFTLLQWGMLAWERASVTREMETLFRQTVPDAQAVVDPPLQMRRVVTDLRRASGALAADDFLALLARAAPEISRVQGSNVRVMDYASGVLRIELALPRADAASQVVTRLTDAGVRAMLDSSSASGSGVIARISIGEGPR